MSSNKIVRMALRQQEKADAVVDSEQLSCIKRIVRGYALPYYKEATLATVSRRKKVIYVNLKSGGKTFCRIRTPRNHETNRVFFVISVFKKQIVQMCYNKECKQAFKDNEKVLRPMLSQSITKEDLRLLFPDACKSKVHYKDLLPETQLRKRRKMIKNF